MWPNILLPPPNSIGISTVLQCKIQFWDLGLQVKFVNFEQQVGIFKHCILNQTTILQIFPLTTTAQTRLY